MKPEPIKTAPKDRKILVYGLWGWESTEYTNNTNKEWRVAKWADYVGPYNEETFQNSGGFTSITNNPYSDYSMGIYWCELPVIEE